MKILTAAQLRRLACVELDTLYAEVVGIGDATDTNPLERHEATHYTPRINKERIHRMEVELQSLKDERLAQLEQREAEQREVALKRAQDNLDNSLKELQKLRAKGAKYGK